MVITKTAQELTAEERLAIAITHRCAEESLDKLVETWAGRMNSDMAGDPVHLVAATLSGYLHSRTQSEVGRTVGITLLAAAILRLAKTKSSSTSFSA